MSEGLQVWFNGTLVPAEAGVLSPFDHGVTVGNGVFETLVAREGVPFAFRRHYERLCRSAAAMRLDGPTAGDLRPAVEEVLLANGLMKSIGRVRITVTGGPAALGSERGAAPPSVIVAATPVAPMPESAQVVTVPYTRNESGALVGLKSTSYGENVVALAYAKERGADEAIFGNTRGDLCEGTGSNVFLVVDGGVITPSLESGCLAGVTRALVIELCAGEGVTLREERVPLGAIRDAPEAFLTSTTRDVQPIRSVDGVERDRAPGPVTEKLRKVFSALAAANDDP